SALSPSSSFYHFALLFSSLYCLHLSLTFPTRRSSDLLALPDPPQPHVVDRGADHLSEVGSGDDLPPAPPPVVQQRLHALPQRPGLPRPSWALQSEVAFLATDHAFKPRVHLTVQPPALRERGWPPVVEPGEAGLLVLAEELFVLVAGHRRPSHKELTLSRGPNWKGPSVPVDCRWLRLISSVQCSPFSHVAGSLMNRCSRRS